MSYVLQKSLLSSIKMIKNYATSLCLSRTLTTSKKIFAGNYEGDGKTTVSIINREYKHLIMVDSYSDYGFRLNNGIFVVGPLAAFPKTILQWNINSIAELTTESLSLFCLLEPKLDILIIGTGDKKVLPSEDVLHYLKSNRISAEILPTFQACSIFNFLNAEGRYIAGAFIPPLSIQMFEAEARLLGNIEAMDELPVHPSPKLGR